MDCQMAKTRRELRHRFAFSASLSGNERTEARHRAAAAKEFRLEFARTPLEEGKNGERELNYQPNQS
jgi:hypothetical protein